MPYLVISHLKAELNQQPQRLMKDFLSSQSGDGCTPSHFARPTALESYPLAPIKLP